MKKLIGVLLVIGLVFMACSVPDEPSHGPGGPVDPVDTVDTVDPAFWFGEVYDYLIGRIGVLLSDDIGDDDMGQIANVTYVVNKINERWGINLVPCSSPLQAANCEFLLKTIDMANAQKGSTTTYGTGSYATHQVVDTIAVDAAVQRLWKLGLRFVAGSRDGKMAYSDDGITWTAVANPQFGVNNINAITYGNGKFVAGGYGGKMAYSTDGVTWTAVADSTFGTNLQFINAIAYGNPVFSATESGHIYYGGMFVAVGYNGKIATSTDGITWKAVANPQFGANQIDTITYGKQKFVAMGYDNKAEIAYSDDGVTWTKVANTTFGTTAIESITYGNGKFVAGGQSGKMAYSADGITWTAVANSTFGTTFFNAITYGNGKFVAGGSSGKMWYSADGITWTAVADSTFGATSGIFAITYGNGKFVAGGSSGKMATSTDGIIWTAVANPQFGTTNINCIAVRY